MLYFRCKKIFVRRKHTKFFYSKFLLQRIFFGRIFRTKRMRVCSAWSFRGSPDPGRLYMAGRVSICRYLKPIDGLPDPKGSLSTSIPSTAIAFANRRIDISLNLVAILPVTVQRVDVVTSHIVRGLNINFNLVANIESGARRRRLSALRLIARNWRISILAIPI